MKAILATLILTALELCPPVADAQISCQIISIGVDSTHADVIFGNIFGESLGESFWAQDTLIKSISVWRLGGEAMVPMKLFITRTYTTVTYGAGTPVTWEYLLNGPILRVPTDTHGDLPPVRVQWSFDPPFVLPGPGQYAFFVQEPCRLYYDAWANLDDDLYPQGHFWRTGRTSFSGCGLTSAGYRPEWSRTDLIFEIEFCSGEVTGTLPKTWGAVKSLYR